MISNRAYHWHLKGKIVSITSSQFALERSPLPGSCCFSPPQSLNHALLHKKVDSGISLSPPSVPASSASHQIWYRVSQLASKHKQFSENAIRAQIFAAKPRLGAKTRDGNSWIKGNGLALAIRKCGRSVLINEPMYALWIATGSCGEGSEI